MYEPPSGLTGEAHKSCTGEKTSMRNERSMSRAAFAAHPAAAGIVPGSTNDGAGPCRKCHSGAVEKRRLTQ